MAHLPKLKQQRYVYQNSFSLNHVLQNLQGYRLATGDVKPSVLTTAREQFGDDEGKVYGALITGADQSETSRKRRTPRGRMRTQRQVKRQRRGTHKLYESQSSDSTIPSTESVSLDITRTDVTDPSSRKNSTVTSHSKDTDVRQSSCLNVLVGYSDSDSDSDSGELGCKGDREGSKQEVGREGGKETVASDRPEKLTIPEVIQAMFEQPSDPGSSGSEGEEVEEKELGFFQPVDSGDSENEDSPLVDVSVHSRWDEEKSKWVTDPSPLCSYVCWKCGNVGHLPQDCTVRDTNATTSRSRGQLPKISQPLQNHYAKCRQMKQRKGDHCLQCGVHSNLACCLDCGSVLCDGRGHLASHLLEHPSHAMLYSYKLGRMLKCCKASCEVVNIYDLYMCSHCLGKAFSQHYSMINATWSQSGLRTIPNALCCEDHFHWHRMNCPTASEEHFLTPNSLREHSGPRGLISEFFI